MEKSLSPTRRVVLAAVSFVIGCVLLYTVGFQIQYRLGIWGVAVTELMILAIAIVSALFARMDLREVFRMKAPSGLEWLGSLAIFAGAFFAQYAISQLLNFIFPGSMVESNTAINEIVVSGGMVVAIIVVSILPGICEEAWHRGYLLGSLSPLIRSVTARVLIMGVVFGLFHMDPSRFLQTMCLGIAFSFIRIKTDSMVAPMALHAGNNLLAVGMAFLLVTMMQSIPDSMMPSVEQSMQTGLSPLTLLALLLFAVALCVVFTTIGRHIFRVVEKRNRLKQTASASAERPKVDLESNRRVYLTVTICGIVALLSFFACIFSSFLRL
ncbi:MAG TPA: hypothetical protein DEB24_07045 [Coriobacteriia bacterium]|nr:hypothetical protein [Coriobacteriia bacterium]